MRSFIKIYDPPVLNAIKVLEQIAIDVPQVCIMDPLIGHARATNVLGERTSDMMDYFSEYKSDLSKKRCDTLISKSWELLGEYDFFFEWLRDPTVEELNKLIDQVDESLSPLGCKYTITTKK